MHYNKYGYTGETKTIYYDGREVNLHRIVALRDVVRKDGTVAAFKGDVGGWIESQRNLSQGFDGAWVGGNAMAFCNSRVREDALLTGDAGIYNNAIMQGSSCAANKSRIYGSSVLCEDAEMFDHSQLHSFAIVGGKAHLGGWANVCGNTRLLQSEYVEILDGCIEKTPSKEAEAE